MKSAKSSALGRRARLRIVKAEAGEAIIALSMHDGLRNLHGKLHGGRAVLTDRHRHWARPATAYTTG